MEIYERNGWLLPNGVFYRCRTREHVVKAIDLGQSLPEVEGWCKVSCGRWMWVKPLTEQQQAFIVTWYHARGKALDVDLDEPVHELRCEYLECV